VALKAEKLSQEIDLAQLRQALNLSQQQLAKKLRVNQPEVAKIEKRADMLLSTLAGVLRAMGAELKIVASFPDHEIPIRSLGKLANGARNGRGGRPEKSLREGPLRRQPPFRMTSKTKAKSGI
jgi:transcriptional regulator with XRE-family HTH domain